MLVQLLLRDSKRFLESRFNCATTFRAKTPCSLSVPTEVSHLQTRTSQTALRKLSITQSQLVNGRAA
jgi:hypothetical protein